MAPVALITGASSLLGRHVLAHWDATEFAAVPVDRRVDDLLLPGVAQALVRRVRPAVVLHLAWCASGTPGYRESPDNDRWVEASLELAAATRAIGAWFLGTGTSVDTEDAVDAYSAAKGRLWKSVQGDVDAGRMTWLRPYYVFDPDRRRPALMEHALSSHARGEPIVLRTPASRHDFVHAGDAGRAIFIAVQHGLRGVLPLGTGRLRRVADIVEALGASWQTSLDQEPGPTQQHHAADVRWLRDRGWTPTLTEEFFDRD